MKKIIVATAALAMMCGSAFAQGTGPAAQSNSMDKPGMSNTDKMNKGTTGMSNDNMAKDGMAKDGMAKGGMVKPDASGQGGSGPGSDQGGTKSMK